MEQIHASDGEHGKSTINGIQGKSLRLSITSR